MADTALAFAKINLSLDVLGRREDGYHLLKMVMQSVSLADQITLTASDSQRIHVETNLHYLPTGENNLAARAARHYWAATGQPPQGLHVKIQKKIPVCAGLAGGSTDGAAVLRLLNQQAKDPISPEKLREISEKIGADVPYCVMGGTALAEGTGEILTPLAPLPDCHILLCKPKFSQPTPELFARIDKVKIRHRPDTDGMVTAIEAGDLEGVARRLFNVFEEALQPRHHKTVQEIKSTMIDAGALGASMSGSGPTVLGIFTSEAGAMDCHARLSGQYPDTFLTRPV